MCDYRVDIPDNPTLGLEGTDRLAASVIRDRQDRRTQTRHDDLYAAR